MEEGGDKAEGKGENAPKNPLEGRWSRRLWVVVFAMLLLAGGIGGAGIGWSFRSLTDRYPLAPVLTLTAIGVMVLIPAIIFWLLKKLVQRLWAGGFLAQSLELIRRGWDLLTAATRALRLRTAGKSVVQTLAEDGDVISALGRLAALRDTALGLFATFLAGSTAAAIIALLIQVASFMVSYAQVEKLADQNRLLWVQTQVTALDQQFEAQRALAQAEYEQIARILLDFSTTPAQQAFALRRLPEAMRRPVVRTRADSDKLRELKEGQEIPKFEDYPNVVPLRGLLLDYMRFDRVGQTLKNRTTEERASTSDIEALQVWEPVSTELFWTLHRLGPPRKSTNDVVTMPCLWNFVPDGTDPAPELATDWDRNGWGASIWHLDHLAAEYWRGLQAPAVFRGERIAGVIFTTNAILASAHLERAMLIGAHLEGADLSEAHLERADLSEAHLEGADLSVAHLEGAMLIGAHLEGADLSSAHLEGADLRGAHLEGVDLSRAYLEGADLSRAHLAGVDLRGAHLKGANLSLAYLEGADLSEAHVKGIQLARATLGGGEAAIEWVGDREQRFYRALGGGDETRGVRVALPPAVLVRAQGLGEPSTNLFLLGVEGAELAQLAAGKQLPEDVQSRVVRFQRMDKATLARIPWPNDAEKRGILASLVGNNRVAERASGVGLVNERSARVAIVSFGTGTNAVLMTAGQKTNLLQSLPDNPSEEITPAVKKLRQELEAITPATDEQIRTRLDWNFRGAAWEAWKAAGKAGGKPGESAK